MRLMIVSEEDRARTALSEILRDNGHEMVERSRGEEALELFRHEPFPLVIADDALIDMDGIDLLRDMKGISPDAQVIIVASVASKETAIRALRNGAYDYLIKSTEDMELIVGVVNRAIEKVALIEENRNLVQRLREENELLEHDHQTLSDLAMFDKDTGLYDYRYFKARITEELKRAKRYSRKLSLIFLDLIPFVESELMKTDSTIIFQIGTYVKASLRRTDLVIRYNQDTFAILLPETPKDGASAVMQKLITLIETKLENWEGVRVKGKLSINMSVASFPDDGKHDHELIAHVERNLDTLRN